MPTYGAREGAPRDYATLDFVNRAIWEGSKFIPAERLLNEVAKRGALTPGADAGAGRDVPRTAGVESDVPYTAGAVTTTEGPLLPAPPGEAPAPMDPRTPLGPPPTPIPVPSPQGALPGPGWWDRIVRAPAQAIDAMAGGLQTSASPSQPTLAALFGGAAPTVSVPGGGAPFEMTAPEGSPNFRGPAADRTNLIPMLPDLGAKAMAQVAVDEVLKDPSKLRALYGNLRAAASTLDPGQRAEDIGNALMNFAFIQSGRNDATWPAYAHAYRKGLQGAGLMYDYDEGRGRPPAARTSYGDPLPVFLLDEAP